MSVTHIQGDLLDFAQWNTIAHSCNAQGRMGKGIAKSIKERCPEAFAVYEEAFNRNELQLGTSTVAKIGDKRVVNMVTQYRYGSDGRFVDYEALYKCLEGLKLLLENAQKEGRVYSLGLPHMLSCKNAGGDWRIVETMIRVLFDDSPIQVYIVEKKDTQ